MRTSRSSAAMWGLSALIFSTGVALAAGQDPVPTQPNPETPPARSAPMTSAPMSSAESTGAVAGVKAKFDALDANHDGLIDQGEAAASNTLRGQFAALDSSADGKLNLAEFTAANDLATIKVDHPKRQ